MGSIVLQRPVPVCPLSVFGMSSVLLSFHHSGLVVTLLIMFLRIGLGTSLAGQK
jgi:hypothetical protein